MCYISVDRGHLLQLLDHDLDVSSCGSSLTPLYRPQPRTTPHRMTYSMFRTVGGRTCGNGGARSSSVAQRGAVAALCCYARPSHPAAVTWPHTARPVGYAGSRDTVDVNCGTVGCGLEVLWTVDCGVEPRVPMAFRISLASRSVCGETEM